MGADVHIIEPCGFIWDDKRVRRVAMDYIDRVSVIRHSGWDSFLAAQGHRRLLLLTTTGAVPYTDFSYRIDDVLLLGRESAGVPEKVHHRATARVFIPMAPGLRSLNVALSAAIVLGEALRQTRS